MLQPFFSNLPQIIVILQACSAGALIVDLAHHLSFGIRNILQIAASAAATGGEQYHSHCTCQQQGYEFFQVLHKGIPPISLFVVMFLFSRKAFATIVAFLP